MLRFLTTTLAVTVAAACLAGSVWATNLEGEETYNMLFKNGTLDGIDRSSELIYARAVSNALDDESGDRNTGDIALSFREGQAEMAMLEFRQDGKHRSLGTFPASVGNPMIMYFYESVVRDMAASAGGSPFYIRNRVKEALVQSSDVQEGEAVVDGQTVATQTVRMFPFEGDPNVDRMKGFGDLELRVTMSEAVPGWYMSLIAEASGGEVYRSELRFDRLDAAQ
ncbi:MAG: hypothetical protein WBB25_18805 [Sulfitobacter sp.]|jgi:hypothetical protein